MTERMGSQHHGKERAEIAEALIAEELKGRCRQKTDLMSKTKPLS